MSVLCQQQTFRQTSLRNISNFSSPLTEIVQIRGARGTMDHCHVTISRRVMHEIQEEQSAIWRGATCYSF